MGNSKPKHCHILFRWPLRYAINRKHRNVSKMLFLVQYCYTAAVKKTDGWLRVFSCPYFFTCSALKDFHFSFQ